MTTLLARELRAFSSHRALAMAAAAHVATLTIAALGWDAIGHLPIVAAVSLVLVLPWTASRCVAAERGNDFVLLTALLAIRPSRLMLARAAAVTLSLLLIVSSGVPVFMLAGRIEPAAAPAFVGGFIAQLALAPLACAAMLLSRYLFVGRVTGWLAATAGTIAIVATAPGPVTPVGALVFTATALVAVGALAVRADSTLIYLEELTQ